MDCMDTATDIRDIAAPRSDAPTSLSDSVIALACPLVGDSGHLVAPRDDAAAGEMKLAGGTVQILAVILIPQF